MVHHKIFFYFPCTDLEFRAMHEGGTMLNDCLPKDRCVGPASIWQENK